MIEKNSNYNFQTKISEEEIQELPLKAFEGNITVVEDLEKLVEVISEIKKYQILGFDTETRPSFIKGIKNPNTVSLLQLSTAKHAFLFRLNKIGLPDELKKILSDKNIIKVGVAIKDDIKMLQKLNSFPARSFIDLKDFVKKFDIENNGLKKITAIVLRFRISKSQRLSNWEKEELSFAQQKYAATDAWVCYEIYSKLRN